MKLTLTFILATFIALPISASAADLDVHEIMERNFFVTKVSTLKAQSTMVLITDKGGTRERRSLNLSKLQENGVDSKVAVVFTAPEDIKGTAFLQIEHNEGDDDLWIYLPALKKSRRLVANNKKDSFVGSDFSYGDILLPKVELWKHVLLRSEPQDGEDCYVVESTPANDRIKDSSGYSRKISWIRKNNFLEARVEYFDQGAALLKIQTASNGQLLDAKTQRWIALRREMNNVQTGHRTIFTFDHVEAGMAVDDAEFTTRKIERE